MVSHMLGPVYPPPSGLTNSETVAAVTTHLSSTLYHDLLMGHSLENFAGNTSSISITAASTQDDTVPFFDFHFSSRDLNVTAGSTNNVTNSSVYRIGSISKLFTVYMLLLNYGWQYWDTSVAHFIPELQHASCDNTNSLTMVDWSQVTIGSLASQLSGVGRDYANGDLASQNFPGPEFGLPSLPLRDIPVCAGNSSLPPCDRRIFFENMVHRHPVFAPQTTPVYSNTAYRILGYVLEALSGTSFHHLLESSVLGPLGMACTTSKTPTGKGSWVIPKGDSEWYQDMGDETPTSGMYASSFDLAKFGVSLLRSEQLSPPTTRRWMKPNSHTSSFSFSVGSPWEIYRTRSQISHGRAIDLYTKSGSIGLYNSQLILLPDYGVVISILAAGSGSSSAIKFGAQAILKSFIPLLEKTAIEQACRNMCGMYQSADDTRNSSLKISSDGDGLYVESWINRGIDLMKSIQAFAAETGSAPISSLRLQMTNLQSLSTLSDDDSNTHQVAYRVLFESDQRSQVTDPLIMNADAQYWSSVDSPMYGEVAVDDFILYFDDDGIATQVEPRVIRDILQRV